MQCIGKHSFTMRDLLYVRFGLRQPERFIIIIWNNARLVSWSFYGIFFRIWSEPGILKVNILRCTDLLAALHTICPIWGYRASPHEWNRGKTSSNTTWNWGDTWPVYGFRTRVTYPAANGEWPRQIPANERGCHLVSPPHILQLLMMIIYQINHIFVWVY